MQCTGYSEPDQNVVHVMCLDNTALLFLCSERAESRRFKFALYCLYRNDAQKNVAWA